MTKSFGARDVLADLDVTVAQGEFVALLGASGSGKTTLLRILAGLDAAGAGDVLVPDVRTVVFQEPRLVASQRVWRNVVLVSSTCPGHAGARRVGPPRGGARPASRLLAGHTVGRRGATGRPGPRPGARAAIALYSTSLSPPSTP